MVDNDAKLAEWVLPLNSPQATLALVGGKGANLAKLAGAGFRVPGGFLLTTAAYWRFVAANDLDEWILTTVAAVQADDPASLEQISEQIRSRFAESELPAELAAAVRSAYQRIGGPAVAVRSSATAEDLPEMSFAGQQDTYLNICGEAELVQAVIRCWG
ncbi:MAG TPA: PEP/pyruvate-binding domain-containing protein, partial [Caldilineaceae bacterium]|nr:PEP/pyruvate-binding domain-containing protein [Caldilineaceae bacterium]